MVINLASLATFKYLDFLIGIVQSVIGVDLPRAHVVLPIGISFFSFQLISYLVDRMRKDAPLYPLRPFALFVLLFPHLIAGPIVRHNELVPQFDQDPRREGLWARISLGLVLFTLGLAKKVLLADRLAEIADPLFNKAPQHALNLGEAWTATLAFTFQLFCDFSAYTEMAIGIALLFGLLLPENFRRPYVSANVREFWRRWHISLSNFIRDYLYIPLGGSRHGVPRYVFATMVTMGICGLWHGAGWTYVVWGLWHGVGLLTCHAWQTLKRPMPMPVGWAITMLFVMVGWVLFRAADFQTAASVLYSLVGGGGFAGKIAERGAHRRRRRWSRCWCRPPTRSGTCGRCRGRRLRSARRRSPASACSRSATARRSTSSTSSSEGAMKPPAPDAAKVGTASSGAVGADAHAASVGELRVAAVCAALRRRVRRRGRDRLCLHHPRRSL